MLDLTTTYLGLKLKQPLVASASPLSKKMDTVLQLEEAGASAIVMYSLFEEQIIHESLENQGVSHPVPALYGEHDIEQLFLCLGCGEEFVATYIFHKNIKKEDSSVF